MFVLQKVSRTNTFTHSVATLKFIPIPFISIKMSIPGLILSFPNGSFSVISRYFNKNNWQKDTLSRFRKNRRKDKSGSRQTPMRLNKIFISVLFLKHLFLNYLKQCLIPSREIKDCKLYWTRKYTIKIFLHSLT